MMMRAMAAALTLGAAMPAPAIAIAAVDDGIATYVVQSPFGVIQGAGATS